MSTTDHGSRKHALLSASGASRWMNCTPSARFEEDFPEQGSSSFAEEGTLAHELADIELRLFNGEIKKAQHKKYVADIEANDLYSEEMPEEVDKYVQYVVEQFGEAERKTEGARLLIEQRVDLTQWIPKGFGSNDAIIIADGVMEVIDLKYGRGIRVSAENNPQLMLYGLGAYYKNSMMYDIHVVRLSIVQPRLNNTSVWDISVDDLLAWGENEVKVRAAMAFAGEGEFVAGDHCKWCRAKPRCRAYADLNTEMAKHDFADPNKLTDNELVEALDAINNIQDWLKTVSTYMLNEALEGRQFPGLKLVEGRAKRSWADEDSAVKALRSKRYAMKDITNTKIKGIGDIEKLVKKQNFDDIVGEFVIKPQGKPALVPESDKRPAINTAEQAAEDFQ